MPEHIDHYLRTAAEQVRWKRARPALTAELRTHLLDQADAYVAQGMSEGDAEAEALRQMGDPVTVGQGLDRIHRPAPQWGLLLLTGLLALAGAVLRTAFGADAAVTLLSTAIGFACLLGGYFLDYTFLGRHAKLVYWGAVILGEATLLLPPSITGVSYYTGYVILLFPAAYAVLVYSLRGKGWRGLLLSLAGGIPLMMITLRAPSFSGGLLLLLTGSVLVLTAIWRGWLHLPKGRATGLVLGLAVAGGLLVLLPFRQSLYSRVMLALHPGLDPLGKGYQASVILDALSGAAPWGQGTLGVPYANHAFQNVLPASDADYLLTTLIHSLGWLPFLLLCGAFLALLLWAAAKCYRQTSLLGRMVALSIVLTLGIQVGISILMNLGFLLFYASCPFVAGNLHTVLDMALMGLLLSVFRQEHLPVDSPAVLRPSVV